MIGNKSVLAIIPARGGSKGVPRKNIRMMAGKPLIAWTIEEAKRSRYIDRLILSTDDEGIIRVAREWDCEVPFVRPAELARDDTPGIEPVLHAIGALADKYDYVVLLQPTSPLRTVADIDCAIERCVNEAAKACVSVTETEKHPDWMFTLRADGGLEPVLATGEIASRRQDLPKVYALNGAVYVAECAWLAQTRSFVSGETVACEMPRERSLDIDTELDLKICEILLTTRGQS